MFVALDICFSSSYHFGTQGLVDHSRRVRVYQVESDPVKIWQILSQRSNDIIMSRLETSSYATAEFEVSFDEIALDMGSSCSLERRHRRWL